MTVQEWLGEDNKLGMDIWEKKYQRKGETFEEWLDRVSGGNQEIRELIKQKKFLFGGRILANRGAQKDGERIVYSNCFVLTPPEDNLESIFECAKKMARTFSCGGGVGIDIGKLAPRGAKLNNAAKETTGAVSFMDLYSLVTGLISQRGRRGALMISIPCDHPDVEEFIECKSDLNRITKANISIRISDDFMKAVENDEDWYMSFVREETGENIYKKVKAKKLYHKFCEMNWDYAEPGMLFWDRISNWNLMSEDDDFEYSGVNPCAEESLPSGGSCMLCSINLSEFVTENKVFNFEDFRKTVDIAIRGINEVMEEGLNLLPLEEQRKASEELKQVGLGIFGLGDMLIKTGIRYGSKESIELCDKIGFILARQAIKTSENLGYEKGDFPRINIDAINNSEFYKLHFDEQLNHLRNSQLLTCAPTGCQKGNTIVGCNNHGLLRLNELVDQYGEKWQPINDIAVNQINGINNINKGFVNGFASTKKITLDTNINLESTYNHKYKVIRDNEFVWCRADELQVGDIMPSNIGYYTKSTEPELITVEQTTYRGHGNFIKMPEKMNKKLAFILGAYYANGSNHTRGKEKNFSIIRFAMNSSKTNDIAKLSNYIFDVFGIVPKFSKSKRELSCTDISVANVNLCKWIEANGLKKNKSIESSIPKLIRMSSVDSIEGFLEGYYMCDGSSNGSSTYIDTASYNMAQELAVVFQALGKYSRIAIDTKRSGAKSKNPMYRVYFGGFRSREFPEDKLRYISKEVRENDSFCKKIAGETFIYNTITHIEDSCCLTYDIEVENNHYYFANGVVSHNTLSSMLGVSGGIEPIFANYYTRRTESLHGHDEYYKVYTPIVKKYMEEHGLDDDSKLPDFFVTAHDLDYRQRIDMQATWQRHIDASISSTINVPNDFTVEQVEDLYMYAWKQGLKGVTIYRDGCKRSGILTTNDSKEEEVKTNKLERGMIIVADNNCIGKKRKLNTGCGSLHLLAYFDPDNGDLLECFLSKGSTGGCANSLTGLSRMISLSARGGIDIYSIVDQLKSCGSCPSYAVRSATKHDTSKGSSCPVAVGNALLDMYHELQDELESAEEKVKIKQVQIVENSNIENDKKNLTCPECGADLSFQGGCVLCSSCGWSRCE